MPITVVIKRLPGLCSEQLLEAFVSEDDADKFIEDIQKQEGVLPNSFYKTKIPLNFLNFYESL